jgi:hypothetical protein
MKRLLLALCALMVPVSSTQAKSGDRGSPITLDCTIKGGSQDGAHMLIIIKPASREVTISGMQGICEPDVTLIDGHESTGLLGPPLKEPRCMGTRSDQNAIRDTLAIHNRDYYRHDTIYDGRQALKREYVQISTPLIEFGTTTWLPATATDPLMVGPRADFVIDRRTGVMLFSYDGTALNANCSSQKKDKF